MQDMIQFKTDRLLVSGDLSLPDDVEGHAALIRELDDLLTPPVLAPLPPPLQLTQSPDAIARWIDARQKESVVLTVRNTDGCMVGLVILAEGSDGVHIGYLLSERVWGQGLATELVAGLCDWFAKHRSTTCLLGGVSPDNPASARVLVKNGFQRDALLSSADADIYVRSP